MQQQFGTSSERTMYNQYEFEKTFARSPSPDTQPTRKRKCFPRAPQCNKFTAKSILFKRLPALQLICTYEWRRWLLWDIIAGLSVGVIHIPQGMSFALVTSVPPALGLYSSLFQPLIYFLFGTSRHLSMGTMAVISIMIGQVVNRETAGFVEQQTQLWMMMNDTMNTTHIIPQTDLDAFKIDIATSVTLLMGAFQILLSLLRLGRIGCMMSMTFIGGFLTGAVCVIITAQVPVLLGLKLPPILGLFRVPLTWYAVFSHLLATNVAELVISLLSITLLVLVKFVVNERCKSKLRIPLPVELLLMVIAILISHYTHLSERYNVKVVGRVASGIPTPRVPSLHNANAYLLDSFLIAIVSFTLSISMAKMLSQKHQYSIDDNQEMLAYGLTWGVSSFLLSFGGAQAPPRTLIHESCGGKTQMAALFSSTLVLLVILFMGKLVESVPNSVLSAIIVVALLPLFKEVKKLKLYWTVNRFDLLVWLVTFLLVSVLDITIGLAVGIGLNMLTIVIDAFFSKGSVLKPCEPQAKGIYRDPTNYKLDQRPSSVRIFTFSGPLFYANADKFKEELFTKTDFNPVAYALRIDEEIAKIEKNLDKNAVVNRNVTLVGIRDVIEKGCSHVTSAEAGVEDGEGAWRGREKDVSVVIIDCAGISYTDVSTLQMLGKLRAQYKAARVTFAIAACNERLLSKLRRSGYISGDEMTADDHIYPTLHDAYSLLTQSILPSSTATSTTTLYYV